MLTLNIPSNCAPIRPAGTPNTIGDNLRILMCAGLLNGYPSLSSAKRSARTLGLEIPFWSWDETIAKFEGNGRKVGT